MFSRKANKSKSKRTRKKHDFEKLEKCPMSRITNMESYKVNCGKNLLIGYKTIKAAEETSTYKDDFVHVVLSKLQDYAKPVIVKVYDKYNFHLHIELNILKKVNGYRNTPYLICEFLCNDDKNRYITKIKQQIRFCNKDSVTHYTHKLHFFVYEYIAYGDISDFLNSLKEKDKEKETHIIKSLILQVTCIIIQLATIYGICHGDINSGNILIDTCDEETVVYCIEGESYSIKSYGILPKIIDFGRSKFYEKEIPANIVWFDVVLALGVIYPYIQNVGLKHKLLEISMRSDMHLPSLKAYYLYVRDNL